jgi:hypothetical protein
MDMVWFIQIKVFYGYFVVLSHISSKCGQLHRESSALLGSWRAFWIFFCVECRKGLLITDTPEYKCVSELYLSTNLFMLCYVMLWPSRGLNPVSTLPWAASSSSRRIRRFQAIRFSVVLSRQSQHAVSLIIRWWAHPDSRGQTTGSVSLSR